MIYAYNKKAIDRRVQTGLGANRLKYDCHSTERELSFAQHWAQEQVNQHVLFLLMRETCDPEDKNRAGWDYGGRPFKYPLGTPDERDEKMAQTLMQWLGTNVGFSFICESLKQCGYEVKEIRDVCHQTI